MSQSRISMKWIVPAITLAFCAVLAVGAKAETDTGTTGTGTPESIVTTPDVTQPTVARSDSPVIEHGSTWPFGDEFPEATGLFMQPPYVLIKLGIATVGTVASGLAWAATLGRDEPAKGIWNASTGGPWTWHGWLKGEKE